MDNVIKGVLTSNYGFKEVNNAMNYKFDRIIVFDKTEYITTYPSSLRDDGYKLCKKIQIRNWKVKIKNLKHESKNIIRKGDRGLTVKNYVLVHIDSWFLICFINSPKRLKKDKKLYPKPLFRAIALYLYKLAYKKKSVSIGEVNLAKNLFLAGISHELRTPLHGIIGFSQILSQSDLSSRQMRCLSSIQECGTQLMKVINDLLDFSKLVSNQIKVRYRFTNIKSVIQSSIKILSDTIREKNQDITLKINPKVPATIFLDDQKVGQVLINLLNNATAYTQTNGHIEVKVSLSSQDPHHFLQFSVSDNGSGIHKEDQKLIFKNFVNSRNIKTICEKTSCTNIGLGLSISQKLVELMDGKITLKSSIGKGSTFTFDVRYKSCESMEPKLMKKIEILDAKVVLVLKNLLSSSDHSLNSSSDAGVSAKSLTPSNLSNRLDDKIDSYVDVIKEWKMEVIEVHSFEEMNRSLKSDFFDLVVIDTTGVSLDDELRSNIVKAKELSITAPIVGITSDRDAEKDICFFKTLEPPVNKLQLAECLITLFSLETDSYPSSKKNSETSSNEKTLPSVISTVLNFDELSPHIKLQSGSDDNLAATEKLAYANTASISTKHKRLSYDSKQDIRILIVEDVAHNLELLSHMLELLGYENISFANSGEKGLTMLTHHPYDILLLDLKMPGINGIDILRKLTSPNEDNGASGINTFKNTSIIIVSASIIETDKVLCKKYGVKYFLNKPVDMRILGTVLKNVITERDE